MREGSGRKARRQTEKDGWMMSLAGRMIGWKRRDELDDSDGRPSETKDKARFHGLKMKSKRRKWPRFHSTFDIIEAAEKGAVAG